MATNDDIKITSRVPIVTRFRANRDRVKDNVTITRKLRVAKGASISARRQFRTVRLEDVQPGGNVSIPFTGLATFIPQTGGGFGGGAVFTVNNVFVSSRTAVTIDSIDYGSGGSFGSGISITVGNGFFVLTANAGFQIPDGGSITVRIKN